MRSQLIFAAMAALLGAPGSASAADVYSAASAKDAAAYEVPANWNGVYLGISGGAAFLSSNFNDPDEYVCNYYQNCPSGQGFGGLFGGTLGYNWQNRNLVLGVEGDISWASVASKSAPYGGYSLESDVDAIATLRLRVGYSTGSNLFYLTGGAAFVDTNHAAKASSESCGSEYPCNQVWQVGFAAGGGYEAMLTDRLSFKAEYLFIGLPTDRVSVPDDTSYRFTFNDSIQIARIGLNYKLSSCCDYLPLK